MNRTLRWLIDDAPTLQAVISELPGRLACAVVTKEESLALPDEGSPEERYAAAGLDLAAFTPRLISAPCPTRARRADRVARNP